MSTLPLVVQEGRAAVPKAVQPHWEAPSVSELVEAFKNGAMIVGGVKMRFQGERKDSKFQLIN